MGEVESLREMLRAAGVSNGVAMEAEVGETDGDFCGGVVEEGGVESGVVDVKVVAVKVSEAGTKGVWFSWSRDRWTGVVVPGLVDVGLVRGLSLGLCSARVGNVAEESRGWDGGVDAGVDLLVVGLLIGVMVADA